MSTVKPYKIKWRFFGITDVLDRATGKVVGVVFRFAWDWPWQGVVGGTVIDAGRTRSEAAALVWQAHVEAVGKETKWARRKSGSGERQGFTGPSHPTWPGSGGFSDARSVDANRGSVTLARTSRTGGPSATTTR